MNAIATSRLVNSDLSLSYVLGDVDGFITYLRDNGLKAGKKPVAELIAGKRDEVAGFYLVVDEAPAAPAAAPTAGAADAAPDFSAEAIAAAVAEKAAELAANPPAPEVVAPAPVAAAKAPKAPKVVKSVAPKGKIKPVRAGTKIAEGLLALVGGVTPADVVAKGWSDDAVDFLNRRVTKRGYGVAVDAAGLVTLVFPEGVTAVVMS